MKTLILLADNTEDRYSEFIQRGISAFLKEDAPPFKIVNGERGKPCLEGLALSISISHSEDVFCVALSECEIGVDIQFHKNVKKEEIAKRYFNENEIEYLKRCGYKHFFDVWAAKESFVKFTGEGIGASFSKFSTAKADALAEKVENAYLEHIPCFDHYSLCLCSKEKCEIEIMNIKERGA